MTVDLKYWRNRLAAQAHSGSPHVGLTTAQFAEILDEVEAGRTEAGEVAEARAWTGRLEKARAKLYMEFKRNSETDHQVHCGGRAQYQFAQCPYMGCRSDQATLRMGNPRRKAARQ